MQFGHFDDVNKEYVIQTPKTPLPWINYLGMDGFFSLVSNTSGGYSFYKDAKLLRLTRYRYNSVPLDLTGCQKEIETLAPDFVRAAFTVESGEETAAVLRRLKQWRITGQALDGQDGTRGHFRRGVE